MPKTVTLDQFLTPKEIDRALKIYREMKGEGGYAQRVCDELIQPNIARINTALGQENDPKFLAYAVEYVITRANGDVRVDLKRS